MKIKITKKQKEEMIENFAKALYYYEGLPFFSFAFPYRMLPKDVKQDLLRMGKAACEEYIKIIKES